VVPAVAARRDQHEVLLSEQKHQPHTFECTCDNSLVLASRQPELDFEDGWCTWCCCCCCCG